MAAYRLPVLLIIILLSCGFPGLCPAVSASVCNLNTSSVFSSIQGAIDNASAGNFISIESGTYAENVEINKHLILLGNDTGSGIPVVSPVQDDAIAISADNVTLDGLMVRNSSGTVRIGISVTSSNVTLRNITVSSSYSSGISLSSSDNFLIIGVNSTGNTEAGIVLASSSHGTLRDSRMDSNGGAGVWADASSNNNTVAHCSINRNLFRGISLIDSHNTTISDNTLYADYWGLDLERSDNNLIERNNVSNSTYNAISLDSSRSNRLLNNTLHDNIQGPGIGLTNGSRFNVVSNTRAFGNFRGISMEDSSDNNTGTDNTLSFNDAGFWLSGASNNTVNRTTTAHNRYGTYAGSGSCSNTFTHGDAESNEFSFYVDSSSKNTQILSNSIRSGDYGIMVGEHSDSPLIRDNMIDTMTYHAIAVGNSAGALISDNSAGHSYHGIDLSNASWSVITGNTVSDNRDYGIALSVNSSGNTVTNNEASRNGVAGISISGSCNNTFSRLQAGTNGYGFLIGDNSTNNTISCSRIFNNSYGVFIYSSSGNRIFDNVFDNPLNAKDDGINIWNTTRQPGPNIIGGPSMGGNSWNDYLGVDTDRDGFGNTRLPYTSLRNITSGGDRLPLTNATGSSSGFVHNRNTGLNYISIEEAVDQASVGDTLLVDNGTYTENVDIPRQLTFLGSDTGSGPPVISPLSGTAITISAGNVTLDGFIIRNADTGISVERPDATIRNMSIASCMAGISLLMSDNTTISHSSINWNTFRGITLSNSHNTTISDTTLDTDYWGIDLEQSDNNLIVRDNVSNSTYNGINLDSSSSNRLLNNTLQDNLQGPGVGIWNSSRFNVISNTSASRNAMGIMIEGSSDNTGTDNTLSFNDRGFWFSQASNNTVNRTTTAHNRIGIYAGSGSCSNTFTHGDAQSNEFSFYIDSSSKNTQILSNSIRSGDYGILVGEQSDGSRIEDNVIDTMTSDAIAVGDSAGAVISNNSVGHSMHGIGLSNASLSVVNGNNAADNGDYGIVLSGNSSGNMVTNNRASRNGIAGIGISESFNNTFTGIQTENNGYGFLIGDNSTDNTISGARILNNSYGVLLYSSSGNRIVGNIFDNPLNARDDGHNIWNTTRQPGPNIIGGPFMGGNSWSDDGYDSDHDGFANWPLPPSPVWPLPPFTNWPLPIYTSNGYIGNSGDWLPLTNRTGDIPLVPDFISDNSSGPVPLTVQFMDRSYGTNIIGWRWSYGDGFYSIFHEPVHTYNRSGFYTVSLSITNSTAVDQQVKMEYITAYIAQYRYNFSVSGLTLAGTPQAATLNKTAFSLTGGLVTVHGNVMTAIFPNGSPFMDMTVYLDPVNDSAGEVNGTVRWAQVRSGRMNATLPTFGPVSADIGMKLSQIPSPNDTITFSYVDGIDPESAYRFDIVARNNGARVRATTYMTGVRTSFLPSVIEEGTITLRIPALVADTYGTGAFSVMRIDREGYTSLLETTFDGYDGGDAVFTAQSPYGFSRFALNALESIPDTGDYVWANPGYVDWGSMFRGERREETQPQKEKENPEPEALAQGIAAAVGNYHMGFEGLTYNADHSDTLVVDTAKAGRAGAAVTLYADRVEIYQHMSPGVLMTFYGEKFDITNGTIRGKVTKADFVTDPLWANVSGTIVSASVRAALTALTESAMVQETITGNISAKVTDQFNSVLAQQNLSLRSVGFALHVNRGNLTTTGAANLTFTVPPGWVEQNGGTDTVHIGRISDSTGFTEMLSTTWLGPDTNGNVIFRGDSPNGTSLFGLFTAKATAEKQRLEPNVTIQPLQKPAFMTDIGMFVWLLGIVEQNPVVLVIVIAVSGVAAYFRWWKRRV